MKKASSYVVRYEKLRRDMNMIDAIETLVNEARREAIEACAEAATTKHVHVGNENRSGVEVDKQSILNLLNEIK